MTTTVSPPTQPLIIYPESDGEPMAENTEQFRWIVLVKENLEALFQDAPLVFVAGDLLWYPVEGRPDIRRAPDALVAFGRPKGRRGSYRQWEEGGIAPQVVFEILSPGNTESEMRDKLAFYEQYGVEEYYVYDPDRSHLAGWQRTAGGLDQIAAMDGWVSPRLGIRFDLADEELRIVRPDGEPFVDFTTMQQNMTRARAQATQAEQQAIQDRQRATQAEQRAAQLVARLRALGIDPDQVGS